MRIKNLHIKNIGPFKEGRMEFATEYDQEKEEQPITIITGMNGAGKSIIIDAIRAALSGQALERNIVADEKNFAIEMDVVYNGKTEHLATSTMEHEILATSNREHRHIKCCNYTNIAKFLRSGYESADEVHDWIIDYWSSKSPADTFNIKNMTNIKHSDVLKDVMLGKKKNVDLVNFICNIDYLRNSEMEQEKALGDMMYEKMKDIINVCLDEGTFKYVRRTDLTPIVEQNGTELSLEKLSNGNIFLIENLLLLACKMFSVCVMKGKAFEEIFNTSGLLLIDEIETHLHPKWQRKILSIIRRFFPNFQIILTTHSPFIVASMKGVRVYTCIPQVGYSELRDETSEYSNLPVDEVLMSDIFSVPPFNETITELIRNRKKLLENGKTEEAIPIEQQLYELNKDYFSYLNVD